jgi:hypothetical protein
MEMEAKEIFIGNVLKIWKNYVFVLSVMKRPSVEC